jgi:adenine/guanine/hypoxanthine permease
MPLNTAPPSRRIEIVAGITTFLATVYIVFVNPSILATEGTGMSFSGVLTATVVLSVSMTLLMGLYAKLPIAVAPGMGINAFFAYTLVLGQGVPWQVALGMVFWAGVVFLVLSITPVRAAIVRAIPHSLRLAMAAGIGLFLTFIGLKNAGLIVADPVTLLRPAPMDHRTLLALAGIAVAAWLLKRRNPAAFLAAILSVTTLAWVMGYVQTPTTWVSWPDFRSVFLQLDIVGALELAFVPAIVAVLFTDLFDSLATLIGLAHAGGLIDADGEPLRLREGLIVDAFATLGAGLAGTSSGTAYIESAAGIEMGGRSGFTAVVTALCFLPCLFLAPIAQAVPESATGAVLILVGALMFNTVREIPFDRIEEALPAYLTIVLIPFTFSITQGILWGFLAHVAMFVLARRGREVAPMMYGLAVVAAGLLWIGR